jgi:pimeloyl-ACP methyl ester carboxylesterase
VTLESQRGLAIDGTWVGTFAQVSREPAFVAVRVEENRTSLDVKVSIRSERIAGARATNVTLDGDRLAFIVDVPSTKGDRGNGPVWRFELMLGGNRLEGKLTTATEGVSRGVGAPAPIAVQLQRALDLRLDDFRPFVGDYQGADGRGANGERDVFFIGYGTSAARDGSTIYAYVTRGDRFRQIVPVARQIFLADDGSKLAFFPDAAGQPHHLQWTDAAPPGTPQPTAAVADRVELWREEELSFESRGALLSGTLYLPSTSGPHPALVFVHGSGPQTRLDNWPMADRFARAGIACLSFDKRGTGKSSGDWQQADFDVLVDDVIAAVDALRARPDIRKDQIGLWGVSQAGWVIALAAGKSDHIAFCIPVSGGAVSPAEQELWRRSQLLKFFGGSSRLLEAMRRSVAMYFQWEQLFKARKFPIPPVFDTEALDMYLDAPAAIRRVHQPVLAIFGESDVLTPPEESAAVWANELEAGGNRDFAVRLFPHATHGMQISDRPFEPLPESQLAPGYLKTMIDWIAGHTGGLQNAKTAADNSSRAVAESEALEITGETPDVVESRGLQKVRWYGSAPVQVTLLLVGALGSLWTLAIWPAAWGVRKFRRMPRRGPPRRGEIIMSWVANVSSLAMAGALLAILRFLGDGSPSAYYTATEVNLWIIAALTVPIAWSAVLLVRSSIRARRAWGRSRWESASAWVSAAALCAWTWFFVYWTWGPLLS